MSFYTSSAGIKIDGSAEASHVRSFAIIPDGTQAPALIKKIERKLFNDGGKIYEVTYKLLEGEFAGMETRQKINPFDEDISKASRNLNMLVRLFKLCNFKPPHSNEPSTEDLQPLVGNSIGIVIRQWAFDGKEGNFISEIHLLDNEFRTVSGVPMAPKNNETKGVDSALTRNQGTKMIDDDIPFN